MVLRAVEPQLTEATLLAEHHTLAVLYESFALAQQTDEGHGADLWAQFESLLLAHLDGEERTLVYDLYKSSPREARVLITEHNHIRARLAELRAARARGKLPSEVASTFYHELCAQMRREESTLYRPLTERLEPTPAGALDDVVARGGRGSE